MEWKGRKLVLNRNPTPPPSKQQPNTGHIQPAAQTRPKTVSVTQRARKIVDNSEIRQYALMAVEDAKKKLATDPYYLAKPTPKYPALRIEDIAITILRYHIYGLDNLDIGKAKAAVQAVYPDGIAAFQQWCRDFDAAKQRQRELRPIQNGSAQNGPTQVRPALDYVAREDLDNPYQEE